MKISIYFANSFLHWVELWWRFARLVEVFLHLFVRRNWEKNRRTIIGLEKPMKSIYYMLQNDMLCNDNTISIKSKEFPSRETNDSERCIVYDSWLTPSEKITFLSSNASNLLWAHKKMKKEIQYINSYYRFLSCGIKAISWYAIF